MKYIIKSRRLGTVGDEFKVRPGINIEALVAGGFLEEVSTPKPKRTPKVKKQTKE